MSHRWNNYKIQQKNLRNRGKINTPNTHTQYWKLEKKKVFGTFVQVDLNLCF